MAKVNISYKIGVDIGGTKMRAVLWNGEKAILEDELATPGDSLDHFLVMLKALVEPMIVRAKTDKVKVAGIGVGMPGEVEKDTGKLYGVPNLPMLNGQPIVKKFEAMLGLPVKVDNDAKTFARSEVLAGAAKGLDNVFCLTIGTGVGGAWWVNNGVYSGANGIAGEICHSYIDVSTGLDFERSYQRLTQNNPGKLSQEAIRGDVLAEKAYEEFGRNLGVLLSNISVLIDPQAFVLGGSVMKSADLFLSAARKSLKEHMMFPVVIRKTKILKSKLGANAGAIGAALLV
jgi:glucokinase